MAVEARSGADWEETFVRWSKPPSDSEELKATRAANMIRDSVAAWPALAKHSIDIYPTGSFHNNTNVRGESDIDVAVVCQDSFFYDLPPGLNPVTHGLNSPAIYRFDAFRKDVEDALRAKFSSSMQTSDKTFNVPENTYRMEADVTPFFLYRRYGHQRLSSGELACDEGVRSISRSGAAFTNWHKDHYEQGVARNTQTGKRFKRIARILKNIKIEMLEGGSPAQRAAADRMPSFLLECLSFNGSNTCLDQQQSYVDNVRTLISELWNATKPGNDTSHLVEVNRRKRLFLDGQPWTQAEVHAFLLEAWSYLGLR